VALVAFWWGWQRWGTDPLGTGAAATWLATWTSGLAFYVVVSVKMTARARGATGHLAGRQRFFAGCWHAFHDQIASCAVAETLYLVYAPLLTAFGATMGRLLPAGAWAMWAGFVLTKIPADASWYVVERHTRATNTALLTFLRRRRAAAPRHRAARVRVTFSDVAWAATAVVFTLAITAGLAAAVFPGAVP
jgi:hypothetical protein